MARHHIPTLAVTVTDNMNEATLALEHLPGPVPSVESIIILAADICVSYDDFPIFHWDEFDDKSHCFDYGDFIFFTRN